MWSLYYNPLTHRPATSPRLVYSYQFFHLPTSVPLPSTPKVPNGLLVLGAPLGQLEVLVLQVLDLLKEARVKGVELVPQVGVLQLQLPRLDLVIVQLLLQVQQVPVFLRLLGRRRVLALEVQGGLLPLALELNAEVLDLHLLLLELPPQKLA